MEYAEFTEVAESAILSVPVKDLAHGDVIIVPGKGKRAVRRHADGSVTLVFPKSGKSVNGAGKSAGSIRDLGQHDPAVVGYVRGAWVDGSSAKPTNVDRGQPKATPAESADPRPADLRTKEGRAWKLRQSKLAAATADGSTNRSEARQAKAAEQPLTVSPVQQAVLRALGHLDAAIQELRSI